MEYSLLNNSLGSLAFEPPCLGEDNLCDNVTDPLLCDLYFNGFNSSIFVENFNPSTKVVNNDIGSLCNDLDFGVLTNNSYALDYMLEDGATSLQQSGNYMFGDNATLLRSCSSISSITSVDDLSFDLLETLDTDDETVSEKQSSNSDDDGGIAAPLHSSTSICSVDDLSFELLETLDTDESVSEKQNNNMNSNILNFDDTETPFCSPNSNSSVGEMSLELIDLLSTMADEVSPTKDIHTRYVKTPESESDITCFNLSPKSVDSGISISSDETNDDSDNFFTEQLNVYPSQSHISLEGTFQTASVDIDFVNETGNFTREDRSAPYKRKQKTPEQKMRKKKQNRNAACKYRSKRKEEVGSVFVEADKLHEKNKELKCTVEGLRKEIDYLKSLMLDVIKARLTKNNNILSLESLLRSST